jgi:hypothetical protein
MFHNLPITIYQHVHLAQVAPRTNGLAYLDPGSGSFILQLLLASLLALLVLVKAYWQKIKTIFTRLFSKGKSKPEE